MSDTAEEAAKFCPHCHTRLERRTDPVLPAEHFDNWQRAIIVKGQLRRLPPMLWKLLLIFWERQDKIMPREILLTLLYGDELEEPPVPKILDVYVCQLRPALRGTPFMIETTHGEGYLFSAKRPRRVLEIGAAEDGIPLPQQGRPKSPARPRIQDHLTRLTPGQSVVIRNISLTTVQSEIAKARETGGSFVVKPTEDGCAFRVWRRT